MPIQVDLPKELLVNALELAIAKRERDAKAATNKIIKEAHEQEQNALEKGKASIQTIK